MNPDRSSSRRIANSEIGARSFDVDNTLATAMIDRLMHHGEAILIEGESFRTGESNE